MNYLFSTSFDCHRLELLRTALIPIHKVIMNAIFYDGVNGIHLYFVNKHPSSWPLLGPITRRQILDSSKLKGFADDNFKFDENGRKFSKWVANTVGKGKIAHYEQFLLFPQCFQKAFFPGASKGVIVWEWIKVDKRTMMVLYRSPEY